MSTITVKHTYADYLEKRCTHEEYHGQFVTPRVLYAVKQYIGVDALRASRDPYFNDIPLSKWDNALPLCPADVNKAMREAGEYPTRAGLTSLLKTAARQLIA